MNKLCIVLTFLIFPRWSWCMVRRGGWRTQQFRKYYKCEPDEEDRAAIAREAYRECPLRAIDILVPLALMLSVLFLIAFLFGAPT